MVRMVRADVPIEIEDLIKLCNIAFLAGCNSYHDLSEFKSEEIVNKFLQDKLFTPLIEEEKRIFSILENLSPNQIDSWIEKLKALKNRSNPVDFFEQSEKINTYKGILAGNNLPENFVTISSNEISQSISDANNFQMNVSLDNILELTINPSFEGKTLTITSPKN